jgi:hypothetical protein
MTGCSRLATLLHWAGPMHNRIWSLGFVALLGCFSAQEQEDGAHDDLPVDGKGDSALSDDDQRAALAMANQLSGEELDDDVGLSSRAADNIAARRAGPDGALNTADDRPFMTFAELDAVPYVGPFAINAMIAYAKANGWGNELAPYGALSRLRPAPQVANEIFGYDFAVSGSTLAIGATGVGPGGTVYIYEKDASGAWVPASPPTLTPPTGVTGFGRDLALDGDTLAVASYRDGINPATNADVESIRIYVRDASGWVQQHMLIQRAGQHFDELQVQADTLSASGYATGTVSMWRRSNGVWARFATLADGESTTSTGSKNRAFGKAVVLDGNRVVVGCPENGDGGAVYIYDFQTTPATRKVLRGGAHNSLWTSAGFGASLAIENDTLVVGNPDAVGANGEPNAGSISIYRFAQNEWTLESTLASTSPASDAGFGRSLSIHDDALAVGSFDRGSDGGAWDVGAVYLLGRRASGVFTHLERRVSPNPDSPAKFGWQVALTADDLIVNAPHESGPDPSGVFPKLVGVGALYVD